ncbi:MAG: aconitate hydratase AcnA [Pseudomonadota bacterium]|nr:aconitate hydratase AcnA [Pseudomonadota bacterium]
MHSLFDTRQTFATGNGQSASYYSLPQLEKAGVGAVSKLPVSIRIVLESVLRNFDGKKITEQHVRELANWQPNAARTEEIPFVVARILLQDFTGVPLLADLAAMRSAAERAGKDVKKVEPLAPVEMVVDHSVQVDVFGRPDALAENMKIEFERNRERYQFLKWGMQAFDTFKVVPPGVGIVHQVNMEYLARGVMEKDGVYYPDTLVGTDSHTTMINGLGVVAWGVGGIEAEAGMLGQPVYFLTPDVVGVNLTGRAAPGVTATDIVLTITEMLRRAKVVGKFVEFFGEGAVALPVYDRATIANMAPEYGATMGFFPVDEATCQYFLATGRDAAKVDAMRAYYKAQGLFGIPEAGRIEYSQTLELDLGNVKPSVAGPKRPQDRINLYALKESFETLLELPKEQGGYGKTASLSDGTTSQPARPPNNTGQVSSCPSPSPRGRGELRHGDVVIAAITSCTNTSNPGVMIAAGLLAKKAVEKGLKMPAHVKTSMGPGSRAVTEYLQAAGLLNDLEKLGFGVVGYGCTTCIGNSGPLPEAVEKEILDKDLVACSVLSGNRNFEARVHQNVKANFLMSPPLVVAFALAGRVDIDVANEPLGQGADGPVFLKDIWPSAEEIAALLPHAANPDAYAIYKDVGRDNPLWDAVPAPAGQVYAWDDASTYIQEPPFFQNVGNLAAKPNPVIRSARALAIFGDSVTTDHISPAGNIKAAAPAGKYLVEHGVAQKDFNSYGARRGNHEVMMRGTFANVRIKNLMISGSEGGVTLFNGEQMSIYDAAMRYQAAGTPLVILAGEEYGTGSSRDWAAKGTRLLGVKAVVAKSFERIHRANLAGMGVLPIQFKDGQGAADFNLDGSESFDIIGLENGIAPQQDVTLAIRRADGSTQNVAAKLRLDTPIEIEYFQAGGILPYVLAQLLG